MIRLEALMPGDENNLEFVKALYTESFPESERRDFRLVCELLKSEPSFKIYLIKYTAETELTAGFLSIWYFSGFRYIEHFAISDSLRGAGIGADALQMLFSDSQLPVVLEVEPPVDEISKRRIGFYQRSGFTFYDNVAYMQPPYSPLQSSVELKLMCKGDLDLEQCSKTVIQTIHRRVYGCGAEL